MALFRVFQGTEDEFALVPFHDGYAYFIADTGEFAIDYIGVGNETIRKYINAPRALGLYKKDEVDGSGNPIVYGVDEFVLAVDIVDSQHGGTGRNSWNANTLLIGGGEDGSGSPLPAVEINTSTGALFATAAGAAPSFGVLPIDCGGTGLNATPKMIIDLESDNTDDVLKSNPKPGVEGVLPIGHGGTGGDTATLARTNLQVYSKSEVDVRATTVAFEHTLVGGETAWIIQPPVIIDEEEVVWATQQYTNTNLTCGADGSVPPIVTYASNFEEYCMIDHAEVTDDKHGIIFYIRKKKDDDIPVNDIDIIIIDNK